MRPWSPSESNDFSPVFSPDNKSIVFSRSGFYGSYSPIAQPHPHAWRFYANDLEGTNVRVTASDGRRVENIMQVGLVRDFPKEKDAWHEVSKLGLTVRINDGSAHSSTHSQAVLRSLLVCTASLSYFFCGGSQGEVSITLTSSRVRSNPGHLLKNTGRSRD